MSETSTAAALRARLTTLDPSLLEITDESHLHAGHAGARSGGGHYRLNIVSACFSGKQTMQRHRMVYDAIGDLMDGAIHALSITARTPD